MEDMMILGLQFFAGEGATGGEGGSGGGSDPGVTAAAPGQEAQLEQLGVPRSEAKKYGAKMRMPQPAQPTEPKGEPVAPDPAGQTPAAEPAEGQKPTRKNLAELIKEDPELNRELQGILSERVKGFAQARDTLKGLEPALAIIARSYGMDVSDMSKLDYGELSKHVTEDDRYWEELAGEYGVTPDVARKIKGYEQLQEAETQRQQQAQQDRMFRNHIAKLVQQGEELKTVFKDFDLMRELQDPNFKRLTSPEVGLSVKDAYYTVHREEIRKAENELIAQRTREAMANSIAAGQYRPREGGGGQAASTGGLSRTKWDKASIAAVKKEAEAAIARGETYYIR